MRHTVLSCFLLLAAVAIPVDSTSCGCPVRYMAVGCRRDIRRDRTLPQMMINERDVHSPYHNYMKIDWHNFDKYLPEFTCRCAQAAKKNGYEYFGLQFWGECWGGVSEGPEGTKFFERHGSGDEECYDQSFKKCRRDTEAHDNCVGDSNYNFIYKLELCDVEYDRLGCYYDRHQDPRPLPKYILTERQKNLAISTGGEIDWRHYDVYLPRFTCKCAKKALEKGYSTFGIQYYGECWSGPDGKDISYNRDGPVTTCTNECWHDCTSEDGTCTGMGHTNFVHRIVTDTCELDYEPVGCFKEQEDERVFSRRLVNDVDPRDKGDFTAIYPSFFDNWEKYMKRMVCRCARKVKEENWEYFGITNGGECYSGVVDTESYANHGKSDECYRIALNRTRTTCQSPSVCSGGKNSYYIYQLKQ